MTPVVRLAQAALAALCATGCLADPAVPAFRTGPYGPGLETTTGGRRVTWQTPTGDPWMKVRVGAAAVRVYDARGRRLGAVRRRVDGWEVERADGSVLARASTADSGGVVLSAEGGPVQLAVDGDAWAIRAGERAWSVRARGPASAALTAGADTIAEADAGTLRVWTHPDATVEVRIQPNGPYITADPELDARAATLLVLDLPDMEPADDRLVGVALGVIVARAAAPNLRRAPPTPG